MSSPSQASFPRSRAPRRVPRFLLLALVIPLTFAFAPIPEVRARSVFLFAELDDGESIPSDEVYGKVGYALRAAFGVGG